MPSQTFYNLKPDKKNRIIEAAIEEISNHPYEHINLANIIRDSKIPRGSFYQYFKDKDDLYTYFYEYIGQKKMHYYSDLFNPDLDMPFLERINQLYLKGFEFMRAYPKLAKVGQKMMNSSYYRNDPNVKKGISTVIDLYISWIKKDQEKGRLRGNLDAKLLASFLFEFMSKITLESNQNEDIDLKHIEHAVNELTDILKKGIEAHV